MLLSTAVSLVNLAGIRLTEEEHRNPAKAKEAIDAARALLPLCPEEAVGPIKDALSQVQMLYVKETQGVAGTARGGADALRGRRARQGTLEDLDAARVVIGVFGGSGFYRFLDDVEEVPVATPYGPPSAPVRVGRVEGADVAFMPRHGDEHTLPPHRINYRANVWAMREVGVRRIIGPSACGSLKPELAPGHVRDLRPVRRPHPGAREHLLRRAADDARVGRRPVLRRPQRDPRLERRASWTSRWSGAAPWS